MKLKLLVLLSLFSLLGLSGCVNFSLRNKGTDYVKVVSLNDNQKRTIYQINTFEKVWGKGHDYQSLHKRNIPKWAKKSFDYTVHYARNDITIKIAIYSNYKYAKLSGVPVVENAVVKLSDKQFSDLNNPNNIFDE